jgi:tetratricopeptide (TPR) repeat protein
MKNEEQATDFGDFRKLAVIFGIALAVRIIHLMAISSEPAFQSLAGNPMFYDLWAKSILNDGFLADTTFYRAPLYPYFVSVLYAISGSSQLFVGIVQALIGSASCVLVYLVARRFIAEAAAFVAGLISSLYGVFIYLDSELVPHTLATFLILAAALVLAMVKRKSRLRIYLLSGLLIGLAAIAEPSLILFGPLTIIWLLLGFKGRFSWKLARWGTLLAGMAVAILPVTLQNAVRSGDFILISSNLGVDFFAGNNIQSDGKTAHLSGQDLEIMWYLEAAQDLAEDAAGEELSPSEVSSFYMKQAWLFIEGFPKEAVGLLLKRTYMLLNGYEISAERPFYLAAESSWLLSILTWDRIVSFPMGLILPLFVAGIMVTAARWRKLALIYCLLLSVFLWPALFFVNLQTRAPLAIPFIIIACAGVAETVRLAGRKKYSKLTYPIAIGLVALFACNYDLVEVREKPELTYLRVGLSHWNAGNYEEAEDAFLAGLAIDSDSPALLNNLGNIYYRKRIYQEAEKKYRRALMIDPDFLDARRNLIRLYERWGRDDMLHGAYSEFLRHFPNSTWGLFRMAEYHVEHLQSDSALVYYERLVSLEPTNPDARFGLASVYTKLGRADEARVIYEDMLQVYPEEPRLHLNLGLAYLQLGMELAAEEEFNTVLYYDSSNTFALYNIARMLEARGDSATATSMFLRILTIDSDFFEDTEVIIDSLAAAARRYEEEKRDSLNRED